MFNYITILQKNPHVVFKNSFLLKTLHKACFRCQDKFKSECLRSRAIKGKSLIGHTIASVSQSVTLWNFLFLS